jgi:hypothetical protein
MKEIVEENKLIAERVPPGDKWELVIDRENIIDGLVKTHNTYVKKTKYKGHYRLEPLNGKLFAIIKNEIEIEEPEPETFDLYGEH